MRHRLLLVVAVFPIVTLLAPVRGAAQVPSGDPEIAKAVERLFAAAVKGMAAGDYAMACPKLAKAVDLAPKAAIGARLTLADCYEKLGKLASAWKEYNRASDLAARFGPGDAKKTEQMESARREAGRLKPMLARLTLRLPAALRDIRGLGIQVDGVRLDEGHWDTPLPVDKGDHIIILSALGYEQQRVTVRIEADGTKRQVNLPMLVAIAAPASPTSSRMKVSGLVLGGVGVVALATGGALVGVASGVAGDIKSKQPNPPCRRTPQATEDAICPELRSEANSGSMMGNAGIGILVGGGALLATGILLLALPSKKAASAKLSHVVPVVGKDGGGFLLTGSF